MGIIETARKIAKTKDSIPPKKIKSPQEIGDIIKKIIKGGNPLEVAIDIRVQKFYSSRVFKASIFKGNPSLEIDTVLPADYGKYALETSEYIELSFSLEGNPYTFKSRFLAMGEQAFPSVTIAYPEIICLHQFRTAERFEFIPDSSPVFVELKYPVSSKIIGKETGLVHDFSVDGLAFPTRNDKLEEGMSINVEIDIPDHGRIVTKATVRQMSGVRNPEYPLKCGIHFEGLSSPQKERIARFIINEKKIISTLDENVYDKDRVFRLVRNKQKIKAKLEGRVVSEKEFEEMKDVAEFENLDLNKSDL